LLNKLAICNFALGSIRAMLSPIGATCAYFTSVLVKYNATPTST